MTLRNCVSDIKVKKYVYLNKKNIFTILPLKDDTDIIFFLFLVLIIICFAIDYNGSNFFTFHFTLVFVVEKNKRMQYSRSC